MQQYPALISLLVATLALPRALAAQAGAPPPETPEEPEVAEPAPAPEEIEVAGETIEIVDLAPPGAHAALDRDLLERAESDDVHAILAQVAGVYLREEDGYGLRPNIGIRGAAAERSAKVALMEDGVLIAPAPYSAPAAYYFPLMTRMSKIEVVKGPAAVLHGPNTVGGAVNLIGEPMPGTRTGYVDTALGSDLYGKLHGRFAERGARWGVMGEYVKLRTDGFKEIDGGGDSGFDKDDAQLWLRVHSSPTAVNFHQLDLKVGWAQEASDETYTGLADRDFSAAPQRRYAATRNDHMEWDHWRFRLVHRVELGTRLRLETTAYHHLLDRAWRKLDGFSSQRDLAAVLADPMAGSNAVYYAILTGEADSTSPEEELILGTNDRSFVSQGVQTQLGADLTLGPTAHKLDAGVRLHRDRADRRRFEDAWAVSGGELVASERPTATVLDSRAETIALALHVRDRVRWDRLEVTAGTRLELIDIAYDDRMTAAGHGESYAVVIPGAGASFDVTETVAILGGVHRGFVPVSPSLEADATPESSINYEAGARWRSARVHADLIGFFSDYSNLKGTCTFSSGCLAEQEGDQFDGGRVHVWGVEAQGAAELRVSDRLRLPIQGAYTLTRSSFQTSFASDFGAWSEVMQGDELPYLPVHQLALQASLVADRWEAGAAVRWHGAMRDVAGQGDVPAGEGTDAVLSVDLDAHVRIRPWAELYATCHNALDQQAVVSRRPWGARPSAPRTIVVGYKSRF
jgi:Fe(3+) dicitrate transport protein